MQEETKDGKLWHVHMRLQSAQVLRGTSWMGFKQDSDVSAAGGA